MLINFADRVSGKAASSSQQSSTHTLTSPAPAGAGKASSLARAFTTSVKNKDKEAPQMGRTSSQRAPLKASNISLPVAMLSTTNMLSYDAPDLPHAPLKKQQQQQQHHYQMYGTVPTRKASSVSSATSEDSGSVRSRHSNASHTTAATSLSVEGFQGYPDSPEQNHLSSYFKQHAAAKAQSPQPSVPQSRMSGNAHHGPRTDSLISSGSSSLPSPQIPSRATSHSMKAHVLSHQRSVSLVAMSPSPSRHESIAQRESSEIISGSASSHPIKSSGSAPHPFGKELEQLNEIAEEFSSTVRDAEQNADNRVLQSKGLASFCAAEYMQEIAPLYASAYGDELAASTPTWI